MKRVWSVVTTQSHCQRKMAALPVGVNSHPPQVWSTTSTNCLALVDQWLKLFYTRLGGQRQGQWDGKKQYESNPPLPDKNRNCVTFFLPTRRNSTFHQWVMQKTYLSVHWNMNLLNELLSLTSVLDATSGPTSLHFTSIFVPLITITARARIVIRTPEWGFLGPWWRAGRRGICVTPVWVL